MERKRFSGEGEKGLGFGLGLDSDLGLGFWGPGFWCWESEGFLEEEEEIVEGCCLETEAMGETEEGGRRIDRDGRGGRLVLERH